MNGDEHGTHEADNPNLRELERRRRRLLAERDVDGLVALAEEVRALPHSGKTDRLLYAVEQNANFAHRAPRDDRDRGLAIGVTILGILVVAAIGAVVAFADTSANDTPPYSLRNDTGAARLVRLCNDDDCAFPATAKTVDAGAEYEPALETAGRYLVADATGRTLGCLDAERGILDTARYDLSQLDPCPPSAPKRSG
jgi:hypothetical protein